MPNSTLVLLHPIDNGRNLSHTRLSGYNSQRKVWLDLMLHFNIEDPHQIQAVRVMVGQGEVYSAGLVNYQNRGGLENADLTRWLQSKWLTSNKIQLLFEVDYMEEPHVIVYSLKGVVSKRHIIDL